MLTVLDISGVIIRCAMQYVKYVHGLNNSDLEQRKLGIYNLSGANRVLEIWYATIWKKRL